MVFETRQHHGLIDILHQVDQSIGLPSPFTSIIIIIISHIHIDQDGDKDRDGSTMLTGAKRITSQVRLCWLNQSKDKSQGSNLVRWMMRIDWSPKLLWRRLDQGSATSCPSILLFQLVWNRLVVSHWLIDWWLAIGLRPQLFLHHLQLYRPSESILISCLCVFPLLTIGLRLRLVILVLPWSFFFFKVYRTHHP